MSRKPTYEELEQRVNDLEDKAAKCKQLGDELKRAHEELGQVARKRTAELVTANQQLKREIQERTRAEKELLKAVTKAEEEKHKYEAIMDSIGDGVSIRDTHYRVIYENKVVRDNFGDNVGAYCYKAFHKRDTVCMECPVEESFKDGKIHTSQKTIQTEEGPRYFENTASSLTDAKGNIIAGIEIVRDITQRKLAEEKVRASEQKLAGIVESIKDAVIMVDEQFNIVWANNIAKDLFGEGLVGKKCYMAYHGRDKVCEPCIVRQCLQDGKLHEFEIEITGQDGNRMNFWCTSGVAARHEDGRPKMAVEFMRDLSELKKLQSQFFQVRKMESIGTLAGGIAHDFNNLLTAIQGHTSLMLLHTAPEHSDFQRLKEIQTAIERGTDLTRQLLGFARGGRYEVKSTDLNALIEKNSDMFGRTKQDIRIHKKYQKGIWPVKVDRGQIDQALLNLYVNAWQAMPGGGDLYIETSNVVLDRNYSKPFDVRPGNYVRISVTDTGVGMDESTRQKIFEPFFTTRQMGHGTGLGLASVYGIITNHGGIIDVDSEKGKKTTFTIFLPALEKEIPIEEDKPAHNILRDTGVILLVDDEDMVLNVGGELLREIGYKVLLAGSGKEGLEVYMQHRDEIDLVILDMIMTDMSGGEVYDRIKEFNPGVKVLLASGYSIAGEATEILERGCNGFIQKPFDINELLRKIREVLDREGDR